MVLFGLFSHMLMRHSLWLPQLHIILERFSHFLMALSLKRTGKLREEEEEEEKKKEESLWEREMLLDEYRFILKVWSENRNAWLTALTLEEQLLLRNKLINAQSVCPLNQEQTTWLPAAWLIIRKRCERKSVSCP